MFLLIYICVLPLLSLAAGQCYEQTGEPNTDTPCSAGSTPTFCCDLSLTCLSIGVCEDKNGHLSMGSCSDPQWSGVCTAFCAPGSADLSQCSSTTYCCSTGKTTKGKDNCCSGNDVFTRGELAKASTLPFSHSSISTTKTTAKSLKNTAAASTGQPSSEAGSASSSSSTNTPDLSTTTNSMPPASASLTALLSTSSTTPSNTAVPVAAAATSGGLTSKQKIGVGVGSAVGFAIFGMLIYALLFLFRRRRLDKDNAIRLDSLRAKAEKRWDNSSSPTMASTVGAERDDITRHSNQEGMEQPIHGGAGVQARSKDTEERKPELQHLLAGEDADLEPSPSTFDRSHPSALPYVPPAPYTTQISHSPSIPHSVSTVRESVTSPYVLVPPLPPLPPAPARSTTARKPVYRTYSGLINERNELGFDEVLQNTTNSPGGGRIPSFSELVSPSTSYNARGFSEAVGPPLPLKDPPGTPLTPAQELAMARARTNTLNLGSGGGNGWAEGSGSKDLRRADSVVSGVSGFSGFGASTGTGLSRGNSVVSGRTEFNARAGYDHSETRYEM